MEQNFKTEPDTIHQGRNQSVFSRATNDPCRTDLGRLPVLHGVYCTYYYICEYLNQQVIQTPGILFKYKQPRLLSLQVFKKEVKLNHS